jgi:uncharacterized protein YdeI (YjbR/CyaY-like superfamily)
LPGVKPRYFATPEKFRVWLAQHHAAKRELLVGFHKKGSGRPSIDWPQSVDEALCFGWIDGVRHSLGPHGYTIRFTPRRPTSIWSSINIRRVKFLTKHGKMAPAGLAAYQKRSSKRSAIYAYEQRAALKLSPADLRKFKANAKAWEFFSAAAPSYRHRVLYRLASAHKPETRASRLATVIALSAAGKKL